MYILILILSLSLSLSLSHTHTHTQYSHTSPHDDWVVGDSGQVAPSRSSDVDSCNDGSWDGEDEDTPSRELEVGISILLCPNCQKYYVCTCICTVIVCTCMKLSLILEQGVGISLINSVPEELLFASLTGIRVCPSH